MRPCPQTERTIERRAKPKLVADVGAEIGDFIKTDLRRAGGLTLGSLSQSPAKTRRANPDRGDRV